jgi:hypothetical protein
MGGGEVQHDDEGDARLLRHRLEELLQGRNAARRGADGDERDLEGLGGRSVRRIARFGGHGCLAYAAAAPL